MLGKREKARVEKQSGEIVGPYPAVFTGTIIIVDDRTADIQEGDVVLRLLPSGKDERSIVTQATFYPVSIGDFGGHYQLKFRKDGQVSSKPVTQNIHINNAQSIQIGDHNAQHIANSFQSLVEKIEASSVSSEEKEEAKSLLKSLLKHPLVNTIIGGAIGAITL